MITYNNVPNSLTGEILHRAKHSSTGCWVYGYAYKHGNTDMWFMLVYTPSTNKIDHRSIDANTIGCYINVKDKRGQQIFTGDFIKADNGHVGVVTLHNGCYVTKCQCHDDICNIYSDNSTIIGNIYDNSLKKGCDYN